MAVLLSSVPGIMFLLWTSCFQETGSQCTFPSGWHATWYQSMIGEVTITTDNITKKGGCVENRQDYYLLENREIGCFTCLLIQQRTWNILQYKESFCGGRETLFRICSMIQAETISQTLMREPAKPTPCPYIEAFHFSYNNNSGGFCRSPSSYVKPCASEDKFRFHFKHCSDAVYTYERDVDMQCLGHWKDGDQSYMVGAFSGRGFYAKEDRYRCLMYRELGTLIYIAMSADASCRGLRSDRDGPVVMELTQDVFGWPQPSCTYPAWLTRFPWRDLSGRHVYTSNDQGNILRLLFRPTMTTKPEVHKAFRCYNPLHLNTSNNQFTAVTFTSHGCTSKYQCVKFLKRKDGVVEIHEGKYMEFDSEPCFGIDMLEQNKRLLIPDAVDSRSCPYKGRYNIHTGSSVCESYFRSGCNGSHIVDIISTCSSKPGLQLECLKTWKENKHRYLVARKLGDLSGTANCFIFKKKGSSLQFSADPGCNKGTPYILRDAVTYVMEGAEKECDDGTQITKDLLSDNQSTNKDNRIEPKYGGSYKHVDNIKHSREQRTSPHNHAVLYSTCTYVCFVSLLACFAVNTQR